MFYSFVFVVFEATLALLFFPLTFQSVARCEERANVVEQSVCHRGEVNDNTSPLLHVATFHRDEEFAGNRDRRGSGWLRLLSNRRR